MSLISLFICFSSERIKDKITIYYLSNYHEVSYIRIRAGELFRESKKTIYEIR